MPGSPVRGRIAGKVRWAVRTGEFPTFLLGFTATPITVTSLLTVLHTLLASETLLGYIFAYRQACVGAGRNAYGQGLHSLRSLNETVTGRDKLQDRTRLFDVFRCRYPMLGFSNSGYCRGGVTLHNMFVSHPIWLLAFSVLPFVTSSLSDFPKLLFLGVLVFS